MANGAIRFGKQRLKIGKPEHRPCGSPVSKPLAYFSKTVFSLSLLYQRPSMHDESLTRAIKAVIKKTGEQSESLGLYFATTIKTGNFCSYLPDPRFPVSWQF